MYWKLILALFALLSLAACKGSANGDVKLTIGEKTLSFSAKECQFFERSDFGGIVVYDEEVEKTELQLGAWVEDNPVGAGWPVATDDQISFASPEGIYDFSKDECATWDIQLDAYYGDSESPDVSGRINVICGEAGRTLSANLNLKNCR